MPAEERCHLANTVFPRFGITARSGPAPAGRVSVNTCHIKAHGVVAVKRMMRSRINLNCHGISSLPGDFGQLAARLCWVPIITLPDQNQDWRHRLVHADILRDRTSTASLPDSAPAPQTGGTSWIKSDCGGKTCSLLSSKWLFIPFRCHHRSQC